MADENNHPPPLGETPRDAAVTILKALVGFIPIAGSPIAELVNVVIPNQRLARIEIFLQYLDKLIAKRLDPEALREKLLDPLRIDLFEEGALQSVRALSDDRKRYIAELVANGISGDEKDAIEAKRLLRILEQIDDDQVIVLCSYLLKYRDDDEFHNKHESVLKPIRASVNSQQDERDEGTMWELSRSQLQTLGLLRGRFKTPKKGESPEIDPKTGMLRATSRELSPLGRLLLRQMGLAGPTDL